MTCMLVAHTGLNITLLCTKDYSCSPGKSLDIAIRSLKFPSFPGRAYSQASIEAQMLSHTQKPPMIYTAEEFFVQNGWCLATTVHGYHSASALEILLQETVGSETAANIYYSSRRSSWEGHPTSFATFRGGATPCFIFGSG